MTGSPSAWSRPERLLAAERFGLVAFVLASVALVPGGLNRFVFAKLALAAAGVAAAALVPARARLPAYAVLALLGAGALVVLAALVNGTRWPAWVGAAPRYEGLIGIGIYLGALAAGARLLGGGRARGAMALLLASLSWAALAAGGVAGLQRAGAHVLGEPSTVRASSLLGNANELGAWAVLVLGPLLAVALAGRRPLHVVGALGAAVALICSGSRGALAGALVSVVIIGWLNAQQRRRLGLAVLAATVAIVALPGTLNRITAGEPLARKTITGREVLWRDTLDMLANHWALGIGPARFADALPAYHSARWEREVGPDNPPDSPHNWLLQATAAGGLGLALIAVWLAGLTLATGVRSAPTQPATGETAAIVGLVAGVAGYAIALLSHFTSPGTTPLAALFAGALLAARSVASPPSAPRPDHGARLGARFAVFVAFAMVALSCVAGAIAERRLFDGIAAAAAGEIGHADSSFAAARRLRPWDRDVDARAAHALVRLATLGVPGADRAAERWSTRDLAANPDSVRAIEDAARLAIATGNLQRGRALLRRAIRLDPRNPELRRALARASP